MGESGIADRWAGDLAVDLSAPLTIGQGRRFRSGEENRWRGSWRRRCRSPGTSDYDGADLAATFPRSVTAKGIRGAKANGEYLLFGTSPGQTRDILAEALREPFDLLVVDHLAVGSGLAGEVLGVPWASVAVTALSMASQHLPPPGTPFWPGTGPLGQARDAALRRVAQAAYKRLVDPNVNRIRAAVGLGPATVSGLDSVYSPHLVLAQGVPGLEYPRADLAAQVHFIWRLPPVTGPNSPPQLPPWWPELAEARAVGRPVVHVTQDPRSRPGRPGRRSPRWRRTVTGPFSRAVDPAAEQQKGAQVEHQNHYADRRSDDAHGRHRRGPPLT